jgi:hypothetical protein
MANFNHNFTTSDEQFAEAVKNAQNTNQCMKLLGISPGGPSRKVLRWRIEQLQLDCSHWLGHKTPRKTDEEVFSEDTTLKNYGQLKRRFLKATNAEYKCQRTKCGISEWLGEPLTLELHHKNGNRKDNNFSNLELLCPNCHTQTHNHGGKVNRGKKKAIKKK